MHPTETKKLRKKDHKWRKKNPKLYYFKNLVGFGFVLFLTDCKLFCKLEVANALNVLLLCYQGTGNTEHYNIISFTLPA